MSFLFKPSMPLHDAPALEDRVDSIYRAWVDADTPENRARAVKSGALDVKEFQPILSPQRMLRSRHSFVPHLSYRTARGLAALAITPHGLGICKFHGHVTKTYKWGSEPGSIFLFNAKTNITRTEFRHVIPLFFLRVFPRASRPLIEWRAKRLIREAVYSEIVSETKEATRIASQELMEACIAGGD